MDKIIKRNLLKDNNSLVKMIPTHKSTDDSFLNGPKDIHKAIVDDTELTDLHFKNIIKNI